MRTSYETIRARTAGVPAITRQAQNNNAAAKHSSSGQAVDSLKAEEEMKRLLIDFGVDFAFVMFVIIGVNGAIGLTSLHTVVVVFIAMHIYRDVKPYAKLNGADDE